MSRVTPLAGAGTEGATYGAHDRGGYAKSTYQDGHSAFVHEPENSDVDVGKVDDTVG